MENINKFNSKNQVHGYQEWYYTYGLGCRANYKHGERYGYLEYHRFFKHTAFYIK